MADQLPDCEPNVNMEAESDPPPELLDLQQKVRELEEIFQLFVVEQSDEESRELTAVEELQKILDDQSIELDEARREAEIASDRELMMRNENANLKLEMTSNRESLERERYAAYQLGFEQNWKNYHERIDELTVQHFEDMRRANEDRMKDRARIDELSCKLAQYEISESQSFSPGRVKDNGWHQYALSGTGNPSNIFELYYPDMQDSISIDYVTNQLQGTYLKCRQDILSPLIKHERLECEACQMELYGLGIFDHLFSVDHARHVRAHGAAVSPVAFEYWKLKLEKAGNGSNTTLRTFEERTWPEGSAVSSFSSSPSSL